MEQAEQLFISLHNCAPKNTAGDEWKNATMLTISSIHRTSDYVFRAIVEQWESVDPALRQAAAPQNYSQEMSDDGSNPLGLPGWRGVHAGVDRLLALLRLLSAFFSTPTASTVTIPMGHILDLTSRLTSVTVPTDGGDAQPNLQISREERESLWAELPRIHAACVNLLLKVSNALETGTFSVAQTILEQVTWVFRAEKFSRNVRVSTYSLVRDLLSTMGPSMAKQNVSSLTDSIRTCCLDVLPPSDDSNSPPGASNDAKGKSKAAQATTNADSFLNPGKQGSQAKQGPSFPDLKRAASELLPVILAAVPTGLLAPSVRAEIDRTIILTADKNAILASVLNPVPAMKGRGAGSSIMPFLARSHADAMDVEGLIRPRMPVLMNAPNMNGYVNADEEEEEDEDMTGPTYQAATESTGFLKTSPPPVVPAPSAPTTSTGAAQTPATSLNKRVYPEEPPTTQSAVPAETKEDTNIKRARFEKDTPAAPATESPASFTGTPAIPVQKPSATTSSAPLPAQTTINPNVTTPGPVASKKEASASGAAEESDDELPTLNLEPDTDDEDEDDMTMDG